MFEQDRLLMRLQQRVISDPKITVCYLTGSFGRRTQDPYSDLDVVLVYANQAERELAYHERKEFVQSIMPYVQVKSFDAEHVRPYFHVALFANGAKADFRYETIDTVEPSPWDRDIHLIKDADNWGEQYKINASAISSVPSRHTITTNELLEIDNRFWVMFMDVYRLLLRGDFDKPYPIYLELLNFTIPVFLRLLPGEDPARRALLHSHYDQDTKVTLDHMRELLSAYLEAREAIIHRYNLSIISDQAFESAVRRLVGRK